MEENFKYHIPEDIPANERTAFHGAAADAAKKGKKSFNFGGKTHPVTMKKDLANKIADQKEGSVKEDPAHYAAIARNNAAKQAERDKADPEGAKKREKAKAAIAKQKPVKPADIGRHSSQGGGFIGRRNEETMSFREKLMSLFESDRAKHYKGATKPEGMHDNSKSSKGAMDMLNTPKSTEADGMKAAKDTAANIAKSAPGKKLRKGDNSKGDTSIIPSATKVNDPAAKTQTMENYGVSGNKVSDSLLNAIAMVEDMDKKMTVDIDHMSGTAGSHEKKHGITLKKSKNYGKGPGSNMSTFASGKKRDLQNYLKKHYDGDHKTMHPEIYK